MENCKGRIVLQTHFTRLHFFAVTDLSLQDIEQMDEDTQSLPMTLSLTAGVNQSSVILSPTGGARQFWHPLVVLVIHLQLYHPLVVLVFLL